jgi:hypothetical protein
MKFVLQHIIHFVTFTIFITLYQTVIHFTKFFSLIFLLFVHITMVTVKSLHVKTKNITQIRVYIFSGTKVHITLLFDPLTAEYFSAQ